MNIEHAKCCACGKEHSWTKSQWWHLSGYYGLSGFVCGGCFEKVSHRDGKPKHPVSYRIILKKLAPSNAKLSGPTAALSPEGPAQTTGSASR